MATYTSHYNLKKPATGNNEPFRTADQNGNMDLIDAALWKHEQAINALVNGENNIGNIICAGYNTGSGNYVSAFIPINTNGKTITAVTATAETIVFTPSGRVPFSNAPAISVTSVFRNGVLVEISYTSTQTANVCASVYLINAKITCS